MLGFFYVQDERYDAVPGMARSGVVQEKRCHVAMDGKERRCSGEKVSRRHGWQGAYMFRRKGVT
ncbi:hypothetical protein A9Q73_00520 [Bermanella sp. 47_1433_sub80_T6]|nr:hypothetical protein A9Q73_00520 [Bermanella sp. 47_1433_sub80_T6]